MPDPTNLDEALLALQADPPVLRKTAQGQVGNQKTRYADLPEVNAVVLSRLNALGVIWVTKPTVHPDEPRFRLAWELKHVASGAAEVGEWPLKLSENPQQMGSAVTYARRYALLAVTGIAAEDEDDDGAAGRTAQRAHQAARQRPAAEPAQGGTTAQRGQRQQPAAARPPLPGESADGITAPQRAKLMAVFGQLQIEDRAERLTMCSALVGRELGSANDLSKAETIGLLDVLDQATGADDPYAFLAEAKRAKAGASS